MKWCNLFRGRLCRPLKRSNFRNHKEKWKKKKKKKKKVLIMILIDFKCMYKA